MEFLERIISCLDFVVSDVQISAVKIAKSCCGLKPCCVKICGVVRPYSTKGDALHVTARVRV